MTTREALDIAKEASQKAANLLDYDQQVLRRGHIAEASRMLMKANCALNRAEQDLRGVERPKKG